MADAARHQPRAGGVALAVAAAALLLPAVGVLSATQAQAAGQAQTAGPGVSVSLTDDSGGQALFPGVRLTPGVTRSTCLSIDASGAATGEQVVLAAQSVTGGLAPWIQVDVEVGSGGGHGSCTGFSGSSVFTGTLAALGTPTGDGYPTGWYPATVATRTFRITVQVQNNRAALGQSAAATFSWRLSQGAAPSPSGSPSDPSATASGTPASTASTSAATAPSSPGSGGSPTAVPAGEAASPTPTPTPTDLPTPTDVVVPSTGPTGGAAGPGGNGGPGAGGTGSDPADLRLGQGLADGLGRFARAAEPLARTVVGVVRHPQPVLWSALAAVLFLLVQHRIDMSDPKLVGASRTQREQMLVFPPTYRPWEGR